MSSSNELLVKIFSTDNKSVKEIDEIIASYDFSRIGAKSNTAGSGLVCALAPSFGELKTGSADALDNETQVMVAAATKGLAGAATKIQDYEAALAALNQNPILERDGQGTVTSNVSVQLTSSKSLVNEINQDNDSSSGKANGSEPNNSALNDWLLSLTNEEHITNVLKLDLKTLAAVVSRIHHSALGAISRVTEGKQDTNKQVLDVSVLRYPQPNSPQFELFRIKISAWSQTKYPLMDKGIDKGLDVTTTSGLVGDFTCYKFKPRSSIISSMKPEATENARSLFESLFH